MNIKNYDTAPCISSLTISPTTNKILFSRFEIWDFTWWRRKITNSYLRKIYIHPKNPMNPPNEEGKKKKSFPKAVPLPWLSVLLLVPSWDESWHDDNADDKDHDYANYDHYTSAMVVTSRQIRQRIKKIWRKVFALFIYAKCIYISWISFLLTWMNTLMILVIFVIWICIILHLPLSLSRSVSTIRWRLLFWFFLKWISWTLTKSCKLLTNLTIHPLFTSAIKNFNGNISSVFWKYFQVFD